MSTNQHSFNVILDSERYTKLDLMAKKLDCSKGRVIRQSIDALYLMIVDNIPTCATGQACYVPHMHTLQIGLPNPVTPPTVA